MITRNSLKRVFVITWLVFITIIFVLLTTHDAQAQSTALNRNQGRELSGWPSEVSEKYYRYYLGTSQGFDLMNATRGGKMLDNGERRNDKAFVYQGRFFHGVSNFEVGAFVTHFHQINYYDMGLDLNYVVNVWEDAGLLYLGGLDVMMIYRDPQELSNHSWSATYGFSNRIRFENVFGTTLGIEAQLRWIYRADIRDLAKNNGMDEPIPDFEDSFSGIISLIYYLPF